MKQILILLMLFLSQLKCERTEKEWKEFEDSKVKEFRKRARTIAWYHGTLKCHHAGFCGAVYYQEDDTFEDDALLYVGLHCTNGTELKHSAMVFHEGGDGYVDEQYEPMVVIVHDCGESHQQRKVEHSLPPVKVLDFMDPEPGNFTRDYSVDLSQNRGDRVSGYQTYTTHWGYPRDKSTDEWMAGNDITMYPSLFEYKCVFWIKKTEIPGFSNCACVTSTDSEAKDHVCFYFPYTAPRLNKQVPVCHNGFHHINY